MRVTVLASGSGGNACVVESGRTRVLVDAGLSAREIERRLRGRGMEPETITALFVTHEHNDHGSAGRSFLPPAGPVRSWQPAARPRPSASRETLFSPFVRVEGGREGRIGDVSYRAFSTPHDADESVAYAFEDGDARLVIASDLGRAEAVFVDFLREATTLLLEFNHDEDMLRDGPYTWPLKKRISGG